MRQKILFLVLAIGFSFSITAQLSDLHYLPPLKQGQNNAGIREQAVYLSTPETATFTVNAYLGTNTTPIATFNISNTNSGVYTMSNGDNNIVLVDNNNTGVVLNNSGLRFESPSGNPFYVNYRGNSAAQAASLTSKGRQAMGQRFKWGGVPNLGAHSSKSNTLGIMATEDNTTVRLFGYDPDCTFRIGNDPDGITDNTYTVTLNANESFVFENYVGTRNIPANIDGWIGATVESDKDIVISNGSINFGRQAGASNRDAGIDQPVPETRLGKEYVFVRGNGNANGSTEFPLIIATENNTNISVNGGAPIATIDIGEYYEVPSSFYSGTTAGSNMLVETSKDAYAYQCIAGATAVFTQGLNFVAPVNCLLPDVLDNIPDIRNMAGQTVTGGMTITAAVNTPDANIQVFENGVEVIKPASRPVAGSTDWKTFYIPNLDGDISVRSTGPMAIGFFGFNGARGVAGYFSGFDTVPEVILEIRGGMGCFVGSEIFEATGNFDAYQWFEDGIAIEGANSPNFEPSGAGDFFVRGTKGPCTYDSNAIRALYCDPDVVIKKSVDNAEITEGETATFTIEVRNLGVGPLTNLQLTDNIPAGLTLLSSFTIEGSFSGNTWDVGTLDGGETATLELEVRGDEIAVEPLVNLTNTVTHTQDQVDTNRSEDIPSASLIVHNDFDNDGVIDIVDVDDDNDGIFDSDECSQSICFESIINESFEQPVISSDFQILNESAVPGWFTTATDGRIELWRSGFQGVNSFDGNQHAELNANRFGALYQNLCLTPGTIMNWSLRHRGRSGVDEMQLRIGADLASAAIQQTMSTDNDAWVIYSGTYTVPADQNNTVFIFEAISTSSGSISSGNFIDDVRINVAVPPTCADSDGDGFPDNIDLDSDNDGCSDANEFNQDNNADGNDGGEFGSGVPAVDPNDGSVIAASYIAVLAPEILLGNTSETTGGTDINGRDIGLGDTFDYVLRFQNTGSDDATNYNIRNVLPANVTLNSIDYGGVIGITDNHDEATNTISFQIPDNLIEVSDPEYTIRIEVTVSGNCSDFVDACSNFLENMAYSTFQGVTNTKTFSDEPGSTNSFVCDPTPQTATNSLLNDLTNCNSARTVVLCGDEAVLTAGTGFASYVWALDANGNGQIDASEPAISDGDPDGDPSTILITSIGNYIVEKSGAAGCADLIELITVQPAGTTLSNPVIDFFNRVNSDANPNNDLQGQIVSCSIDGSQLPQIFLCGASDDATIQLGITDAISIDWELLDETSCTDSGDECANTNNTCTWNPIGNGNNFTITDEGRYRVVINYTGGCFSRFYFNVFINTLNFTVPTPRDIVCGTPGNIRIAGIGSGFGYQLVDVATNNAVVPFSANNGPNFDIITSGNYKVQITSLDTNGNPIEGACVFETNDIGIQERNYDVTSSAIPADCSGFGEITVQALNVFPNYNYQLFLDDGTTLVAENLAETDNNNTFTSVLPGDYVIITSSDDGCTNTQNITVAEIPDLNLSASVTDNITCNAGLISLSPSGGEPDPDYRMAIYSDPTGNLYASPADAIANASFQNTNDFLFPDSTDAGDYEFIVFDSNDCFVISNVVTLQDLGTVSIAATNTAIVCSGSTTSILTITASGGTAPYEYSLDGTTYQATNTFTNLGAGSYEITVRDSSGTPVSRCIESVSYDIVEPFRLIASASIVEDLACDPTGTLVRILNASGGQAPYEYSFDGGSNFSSVNERSLATGTYQLVLRDDLGCTFDMDLTVPSAAANPVLTSTVDYGCVGEGSITVNTSNTADFNYTYSLDGGTTTQTSNIFPNVPAGTETVTIGYSAALGPNQSNLFFEDFGAGTDTQSAEAGSLYCFEPQDGTVVSCNKGPAGIFVNGEYTVTNLITNPNAFLRSPQDHTGLSDGRFFAIDISTFSTSGVPQPNNILWAREALEVAADRELTLNFWAYNLMTDVRTDPSYVNPEILVQILDNTGAVIHTEVAPEIPKNTNNNDWHQRTITFDPGANTEIDIVFRTNRNNDDGNDLILDDISVSQLQEVCERTQDLTVVVEADQAFEAQLLSITEPSCNAVADGAIRFEVDNFDSAVGFEYSVDGGTTWILETTSPFTTPANLAGGTYTVMVRKANETSCSVDFIATLTEPNPVLVSASITQELTCIDNATITASATGGTPTYNYQLEDNLGNVITGYDFVTNGNNTVFSGISIEGDYIVRARDTNNCEDIIDTPLMISAPADIVFDTTPTACYSGASNGSILVNVTAGNGNYEFRIDGGPWISPNPSTATNHSFNGLSEGNYDIEVRDQLGCPTTPNVRTVVISPQLIVDIDVTPLSACNDGLITVNAAGGNGTLLYAIVPANTSPSGLYNTANTLTVTEAMATANPAGYDVYVQDNNGSPAICSFLQEDIILTPVTALSVTATPTDPECFDGFGFIDVTVNGGTTPYTYTLVDLSPADGIDYGRTNTNISTNTLTFNGIGVGNYEVTIEDTFGCAITSAMVTIHNAIEITADIIPILPANCASTIESDFGFEFTNITNPVGTVEYSNDGGNTWQASPELRGTTANPTFSGTEVFPSIRVEVATGVFCQEDFDRYIIPFPLDDLDITLSAIIVGCNDLQVTVQGSEGDNTSGYDYTYTDDPANFNTFIMDPNVWVENVPDGTAHTFQNIDPNTPQYPEVPLLVPGRTYVFYVRDGAGCIRQSNVNVNDIPGIGIPIKITADITPTCDSAANGSITFNLNPTMSFPNMRWEIFELGNTTPIETSGGIVPFNNTVTTTIPLGEGEYYIEVVQVDGSNADACRGASENAFVPELAPLSATAVVTRDIACNVPGLISIKSIAGGGGAPYTYDVNGPAGFTALTATANNPVEIPVNSPAGNYTVTLYDQFSCPLVLNTVSLTVSPNPTLSLSQENCASPITVNATGGSAAGNLRYAIVTAGNPAPTTFEDNAGEFTNVTPGSYDVYVIDGNGCTAVETDFIVNPVLSASASLTKLLDCTVAPDATINIEILDGSGTYEYNVTGPAGAVTQTTVPSTNFNYQASIAGDYTITIFDSATPSSVACNREFVINVPDRIEPIIDPAIATTDITCIGDNDGTITISTTNGAAAPYIFEITSLDGTAVSINPTSNTATSATFTGLAPTTTAAGYIVTVTGDTATNNCSVDSASITIDEPTAITVPTPTVVEFGCATGNSANNASIAIDGTSVTGGSGNFIRYEFIEEDDPNTAAIETAITVQNGTSTTYIETDFAGGAYTINVYDDKGCVGTTTATIIPFDEILSTTVTVAPGDEISCTNAGETITIDVVGSNTNVTTNPAAYEFGVAGSGVFQASNQFSDLPTGTHTFIVRNTHTNCETTVNHIVEEPNTFDVQVTNITNVVCHGDDGSIDLILSDPTYTGSFSYEIFDTMGTTTDTDDVSILGSVSSIPIGTTGPINVPAGEYTVMVTQDAFPECSQSRTFTISGPSAPLSVTAEVTAEVGCMDNQGAILVTPSGGMAPYTITIDDGSGSITSPTEVNNHLFQGLGAGTYSITITDALGCSVPTTPFPDVTLISPDPIAGTLDVAGLDCPGDTNGTITFVLQTAPPRNVTPNYSYVLHTYDDLAGTNLLRTSTSQTNDTFNNLGAGFYSITVMDDIASCPLTVTPIEEIVDPSEVQAQLLIDSPVNCAGEADLLLEAFSGIAPYEWSEDGVTFSPMNNLGGTNTHLFASLPQGSYSYFVREISNPTCEPIISNTATVVEPEALSLSISDSSVTMISCNGESTGLLIAEADGAFGNYQYEISSDNTFALILETNTDGIFADLSAGDHYIRVQSRDCETVSVLIPITEPEQLVIDPVITEVSCHDSADGSITLNATGGSGDYIYAISPNLALFNDENVFEELAPGDYTVIVQDSNNCMELVEFTLVAPEEIAVVSTITDEICFESGDGTISLEISGGTAPYFTALDSNIDADFAQDVFSYSNLSSGTHVVFVKDANGCEYNEVFEVNPGTNLAGEIAIDYSCSANIATNSVSVVMEDQTIIDDLLFGLDTSEPSEMGLETTFEGLAAGDHFITILHSGGCLRTIPFTIETFEPLLLQLTESDINTISAVATGGSEVYTFTINGENKRSDGEFRILATDTYTITVTDENGCSLSQDIFIEFIDIEIPTFFTPDGDGLNDRWVPRNISQFPNIFIKVYDRYGREVYQLPDNQEGWDGLYNDSNLPTGDYWYIIKLNGMEDTREFVGNFTLYR